jgi:hypothetical protein
VSLPDRIRDLSREEANRAFRDFMAVRLQQGGSCTGVGEVISINGNTAQVKLASGEIKSYIATGNRPIGPGVHVQIIGGTIA